MCRADPARARPSTAAHRGQPAPPARRRRAAAVATEPASSARVRGARQALGPQRQQHVGLRARLPLRRDAVEAVAREPPPQPAAQRGRARRRRPSQSTWSTTGRGRRSRRRDRLAVAVGPGARGRRCDGRRSDAARHLTRPPPSTTGRPDVRRTPRTLPRSSPAPEPVGPGRGRVARAARPTGARRGGRAPPRAPRGACRTPSARTAFPASGSSWKTSCGMATTPARRGRSRQNAQPSA